MMQSTKAGCVFIKSRSPGRQTLEEDSYKRLAEKKEHLKSVAGNETKLRRLKNRFPDLPFIMAKGTFPLSVEIFVSRIANYYFLLSPIIIFRL